MFRITVTVLVLAPFLTQVLAKGKACPMHPNPVTKKLISKLTLAGKDLPPGWVVRGPIRPGLQKKPEWWNNPKLEGKIYFHHKETGENVFDKPKPPHDEWAGVKILGAGVKKLGKMVLSSLGLMSSTESETKKCNGLSPYCPGRFTVSKGSSESCKDNEHQPSQESLENNEYMLQWAITTKQNVVMGRIFLIKRREAKLDHSRILGYHIGEEFSGKGYTTEAARRVTEYAFKEMKIHRIQASVNTSNAGSSRVLEKLGFKHEGTMKDYYQVRLQAGGSDPHKFNDRAVYGLVRSSG